MANKKGDAPMLWIVIVAVLCLLALVIIAVIFGSGIKDFVSGKKDCAINQGKCVTDCPAEKRISGTDCPENKVCCLNM